MNIYLDIDGVLLAYEGRAANFADEFLQFILTNFPNSTYWLTTHQWRGQNTTWEVLSPTLKPKTMQLLSRVKPTDWGNDKTDGINFGKPFFWYDDDLYPEEMAVLKLRGALPCHRRIDLFKDPNQLMDEIEYLKQFV